MHSLAIALVFALLAAVGASAAPPDAAEAARTLAFDRFATGRDALNAKRWADAETAFGEAIRLQPGLAIAHYGLGQALMGQGRYAEAADAFLSCRNVFALARRPDASKARDTEIRDLRDTLQALAGRRALSADRFLEMQLEKRLAELQKDKLPPKPWVPPGVTMALGTAYFQAGALEEAENEFMAVLRQDPSSGDAENNLAVLYLAMGRLDEAEAAVARAEKAGVKVSPRLRDEIRQRRASPSSSPSPWPSPSPSPSP
ncbi:MAG TPA: tetratricopeptide repeat protein [Vicinamibacteria bacterium]|nr:tetratricopeptide repeat protein [Vicinamibacteria bacterium]